MSLLAILAASATTTPDPDPDPTTRPEPWPAVEGWTAPTAPTPTTVAEDTFTTDGPLNGRSLATGTFAWSAGAEWTTSGGRAAVSGASAGSFATFGSIDQDHAVISGTINRGTATRASLVFRYLDAANHARFDVTSTGNALVQVADGVTHVIWSGGYNEPTLDIYSDFVVLSFFGNPVPPVAFSIATDFATHTGVGFYYEGDVASSATFDNIKVTTTGRIMLNWPRIHTLGTRTFPDISLGPAGAWDSTDINNPNVMAHPDGGWLMSYTGHYENNPYGTEVQEMGLAYATTLDGPWTKDPLNPAFTDPNNARWNINGGLALSGQNVWVQAYGTGINAMTIGVATAPIGDLHDWTVQATAGDGKDSYARTNDSGYVEIYTRSDAEWVGIWRTVTRNSGQTFVRDAAPVLEKPWWLGSGGGSFAEAAVFVPSGQEGKQMLVTLDRYKTGTQRRETLMAITVDAGASWQWAPCNVGGSVGQGDASRFDSEMVYDGAGGFYLYYCGSDSETDTLGGGLQIGHRRVDWDPSTLVR